MTNLCKFFLFFTYTDSLVLSINIGFSIHLMEKIYTVMCLNIAFEKIDSGHEALHIFTVKYIKVFDIN